MYVSRATFFQINRPRGTRNCAMLKVVGKRSKKCSDVIHVV